MTRICPFAGYLVDPAQAPRVVAPSYDTLSPAERVSFALSHPENYLNVMRSADEYDDADRPSLDDLLEGNRQRLQAMLEDGAFKPCDKPVFYIYRLTVDDHEQTGLVAEVPLEEYEKGWIKRHEHTRSDKEDLLARYQEVVGASSSPIALAYRGTPQIDEEIRRLSSEKPLIDFTLEDGLRQTIWPVVDPGDLQSLRDLFADVATTYLTDGHHRAASAVRLARSREQISGDNTDDAWRYLLVALFPDNGLRIKAFNRCVRDLNGMTSSQFLDACTRSFEIESILSSDDNDRTPRKRGEFTLLLEGNWYRFVLRPELMPEDPVAGLDVSILNDLVFQPILGIDDVRSDPRLEYVADLAGAEALESFASNGFSAAFRCYPTAIEELMQVADIGDVMPPKSTCFDPKSRSGIFLRLR